VPAAPSMKTLATMFLFSPGGLPASLTECNATF